MEKCRKKKFSIVSPIYYNEENIPYTMPRLLKIGEELEEYELELVFVDDGSRDKSLQLLLEYRKQDKRIKIIKLSKNVGAMAATQAGLEFATGDCVGIIAADLQDPPELFIEMIRKWESGSKVVLAVRADREESWLQKLFSNAYYKLMDRFAIKGYPPGGFDFVLLARQAVDEINCIKEKNTNIMSLIFWLGYPQSCISYVRRKREHGKSKWTFSKKVKLFIDSFVSFSYTPIRLMSLIGFITALFGFTYGFFIIIQKLTTNIQIEGWTTIIVLLNIFLGMIMMMLGIMGEYLWRILDETRNRPPYIVDEVYD